MAGGVAAPRAAVLPTLKGVLPWEGRCAPVGRAALREQISSMIFVLFFLDVVQIFETFVAYFFPF